MNSIPPTFWTKEFDVPEGTPPLDILQMRAASLADLTGGLLEAFVLSGKRGSDFHYQFYLRAPALDNYTYLVLTALHQNAPFPLTVIAEITDDTYTVHSEKEFIEKLGEILSSEDTSRVIRALLEESQETAAGKK